MDSEKIYCQGTDPATLAALMNNNGNAAEMAMLANNNNWNNSPWMYLIFLALFGGNGFGFGNRGAAGAAEASNLNTRLSEMSNQMSDNHNNDMVIQAINGNRDAMGQLAQTFNTDVTAIQTAICSVKSAIEQVGGQVGYSAESVKNAIAMGDANIVSKMQECCCSNKMLVQQMGYEGQLRDQANTSAIMGRIDQLANGVQTGFAQVGYATAQQTCDIKEAITAGNQRIVDVLNAHWSTEQALALQDAKLKLSQSEQNQYLLSQLKSGCNCCS